MAEECSKGLKSTTIEGKVLIREYCNGHPFFAVQKRISTSAGRSVEKLFKRVQLLSFPFHDFLFQVNRIYTSSSIPFQLSCASFKIVGCERVFVDNNMSFSRVKRELQICRTAVSRDNSAVDQALQNEGLRFGES